MSERAKISITVTLAGNQYSYEEDAFALNPMLIDEVVKGGNPAELLIRLAKFVFHTQLKLRELVQEFASTYE